MIGRHHPPLQRPTQFDLDEFRRPAADPRQESGVAAFARYRLAIEQFAADRAAAFPRPYACLAIVFQTLAMATVFAPWGQYQTRDLRIVTMLGTDMHGTLLVIIGGIAWTAMVLTLTLDDKATAATTGFTGACICAGIAALTWVSFGSWDVRDTMAITATNAVGWGVVAATFANSLAAICAFYVMQVARLY